MDGLWATKSEGVELIVHAISFQDFKISNLCGPDPPTSQTDRWTDTDRQADRQTTCNRNTALCTIVHHAVKMMISAKHVGPFVFSCSQLNNVIIITVLFFISFYMC